MSILIKGMDMPTSCGKCYVGFCKQIGCELSIGFDDYKINRHPNCTLVPVPPHGRLIDAGYVYAGIETKLAKFVEEGRTAHSQQYEFGYWRGIEDAKSALSNAPTIIEAEKGK